MERLSIAANGISVDIDSHGRTGLSSSEPCSRHRRAAYLSVYLHTYLWRQVRRYLCTSCAGCPVPMHAYVLYVRASIPQRPFAHACSNRKSRCRPSANQTHARGLRPLSEHLAGGRKQQDGSRRACMQSVLPPGQIPAAVHERSDADGEQLCTALYAPRLPELPHQTVDGIFPSAPPACSRSPTPSTLPCSLSAADL